LAHPSAKPRTGLVIAAALIMIGLTACAEKVEGSALAKSPSGGSSKTSGAQPAGTTATCSYSPTPGQPAAKPVGVPGNSTKTPAAGTAKVTLKTNQGDIPLTLDRAQAPCTVENFLFLTGKKYYDGVPCHRLTINSNFKVLQCGDPSGTGSGGPGYQFADELPKNLKPYSAEAVLYTKGLLAMANAGPGTNGSQFFLVYGDTPLPPSYTVFGLYNDPGQATIDKIAAGGIDPASSNTAEDGAPKTPVTIQLATIEG
jgi:peptidyl-prolyl cis-trans isomerase B (cyclophilin B)